MHSKKLNKTDFFNGKAYFSYSIAHFCNFSFPEYFGDIGTQILHYIPATDSLMFPT